MEQRTSSPYPGKDRPVLAVIGILLVVSTVVFAVTDHRKDWRYYQATFRSMVAEKFGAEKAATLPAGMKQIWVKDLGRADRCITCHQGILWKGFEAAEHPWKTHPSEPLKAHPIEAYGCTACHGGQGWAVESDKAHGPVQFWEEPVLGPAMGNAYSIQGDDKGASDADELQRLSPVRPGDEGRGPHQPRQEDRRRRRAAGPATSSTDGAGRSVPT